MTDNMNEQFADFQNYYVKSIKPLIEDDYKKRDRLKGKFWLYFGIVFTFNCVNLLIALFRHLIHGKDISWSFMFVFAVLTFWLAYLLIKQAKKNTKYPDIMGEYIKYFGDWAIDYDNAIHEENKVFLPQSPQVQYSYVISGLNDTQKFVLREINFLYNSLLAFKKQLVKRDDGIWLSYKVQHYADSCLMVMEKGGFFKAKKIDGMERLGDNNIPVANYFMNFANDVVLSKYVVGATLFEHLLDLKEAFKAQKIYMQINNGQVDIFLQKGRFAYQQGEQVSKSGEQEKFVKMNKQMEKMFNMFGVLETLFVTAYGND